MARKSKSRRGFNNRVVTYLRYSTHNQNELSIEYQLEEVNEYCAKAGYTIVKHYIDEAKSGKNDKRQAFQEMIDDAHNNPTWSKIIIFSFNRFSRSVELDGHYKTILSKIGIDIESATENNANTPEARLARNMTCSFSAYMPEACAVHTHAALKTKAKKCQHCGGVPPLGYDIKDEMLVINDYEAETVRLIFNMYDKNYSYNDMIKVLNAQGRTTKKGCAFQKTSFSSILMQEKYKGIYVWNKTEAKDFDALRNNHAYKPLEEQVRINGGCPAIIDTALFDRVQEKMKNNRKQNLRSAGDHHYMLGGMQKIYCENCGALMVGSSYKSHGKNYRYYVCPNHRKKGCPTKNLRASYIEHLICSVIVTKILTRMNYSSYNPLIKEFYGHTSKVGLKKELNGIKNRIYNLLKNIEICPTDEATERLRMLTLQKEAVLKKMNTKENVPEITPNNLKNLKKKLYNDLKHSLDPVIYEILYQIIEKITVSNDGVEIELTI